MFFVSSFLAIFCISSALSEVCDIADHDCTTNGANNRFGSIVNGIDNIVEASDPLWIDVIQDKQPTISYKFTNASLSGLTECVVTNLKIEKEALNFLFNLECPHIVIKTDYEAKGNILSLYIEGKGILTVTADDYIFIFNCKYEKTMGEDNKLHVQIKSYTLDVDPREKMTFDITNLFNGHKVKSDLVHKFMNENWRTIHKLFRTPTMDRFMELFVGNLNKFLKAVPVQNVLSSKS